MRTKLRIKCSTCGYLNGIPLNKIFLKQPSPEANVKVLIPMCEFLQVFKCVNCGKIIAEPKELIKTIRRAGFRTLVSSDGTQFKY